MDILSNFSEMFDSLIFEQGIGIAQFSEKVGIDASTIYHYLQGAHAPTVENLVKIADYFQCTTDYLLGREQENYPAAFQPCPSFPEQLKNLKEYFECPWWTFYRKTKISPSRFYEWRNGKHKPTLDSIILLAEGFDCTVDFILGRTKI